MMQGDELDRLMTATLAGDSVAYQRLLILAATRLRAYFGRRISNRADCEDLVQECLLAIHNRRDSYDPQRQVAPWIYAIARYKLVDHFRRSGRRAEVALDEAMNLEDWSTEAEHAKTDLERLLHQLPLAQAMAVRQIRIEGYSSSDLAGAEIGASAFKLRVHRGLARLKALVAENGE